MHPSERRAQIEHILRSYGNTSVEELARRLRVTPSTIRRDLGRLTVDGKVTRTYGGAVISMGALSEPTVQDRETQALAEKDAIARWAAAQILPGETVILDAGTTTARVAHHLSRAAGLTVITNGLPAVIALAAAEDIDLVVLGGRFRHISHGLVGPFTELTLNRLTADRAFLGADGLVAGQGICEASPDQTGVKETMIARSREVYVVADSSKLGHAPFHAWTPLGRRWTLVTDNGATEEQLAPFRARSEVNVVTVERPADSAVYGAV